MKKIILFFIIQVVFFVGCNKGCSDENACNDGMDEPCKYSDEQESLLEGKWELKSIRDSGGDYLFSSEEDSEYELNEQWDGVHIEFDDDKTCEIETSPSAISDQLVVSDWSIDACFELLNFKDQEGLETETNVIFPDYWPFNWFRILELNDDVFICEDTFSNILHWDRD